MQHALRSFLIAGFVAAALLLFALLVTGCRIAGDYDVAAGADAKRGYRTIAGNVYIGRDAIVGHVKTVAGDIRVAAGAKTRSLRTVAGDIQAGESVQIDGDVATTAGDIVIAARSHVTGGISSTAGAITLEGCRVEQPVRFCQGALSLRGETQLPGGVVVEHNRSTGEGQAPHIDIGPGATVAAITVEPRTTVELRVSRAARVGPVTGATATYY